MIETTSSSNHRGLFAFSFFTAFVTYLLLVAGGLVTSHEAGLAVPDWPLSYGQWMPPMVGNIFWEHGHRMIASFVGLLTVILTIWTHISDKRKWVRQLTRIALLAVILQGVLGGLTVTYLLPAPVSIFHACLAQTFFCLLIAITFFHSFKFNSTDLVKGKVQAKSKRLLLITTCMIFLQLILGAAVRHTDMTAVPHILVGLFIFIHAALILRHIGSFYPEDKALGITSMALGLFTITQIFLGFGAFMTTRMGEKSLDPEIKEVLFTASHHSVGALVLAASFFLTLVIFAASRRAE